MVLKRLLVTTLGALGLGALAAGTASGQSAGSGNIPAPDIFDDQILCSMFVPSMTPTPTQLPRNAAPNAMTTLDTLIGMGTVVIDTAATGTGTYEDLGYVIPPTGMNCGLGAEGMGPTLGTMNIDGNNDGDFVDVGDTLDWGDVPRDVANGYSELLPLFTAVYGAPAGTSGGTARALAAAQKALSDGITAGTTGPALTVLQNAVTTAQTAHNRAMAAFNAASQGPIYQAGVAEWMAKAAVTKSVADYNMQVTATNMAQMTLDDMDYASYVPLGNTELVTTVVTFDGAGMATIAHSELAQYANAVIGDVAMNSGTINAMGVTDSTNGNFTASGQLIVPMSLQDHDNDASTDDVLRPVLDTTNNGVDDIRTRVTQTRAAAAALKKLADDTRKAAAASGVDSPLQRAYDTAAARAQAEATYYNAEWAKVLADNTNQNSVTVDDPTTPNVNEAAPFSIASRNAAYTTANNKRIAAEADVRAKVAAREAATANVRSQFNGAQSFYEQLVARRMALKAKADAAVATATKDGGTAPKNLTDAVAAAQKALDAANKAKMTLDALFADEDDPTVALITELLKTGGNDGQALVDAISSNYDTANTAKKAADDATMKANEVADSVSGLTGEGGTVAMNTERSMQNESDIEALDGRVTVNEGDIATNKAMIMTNTESIATNAGNIKTNADNIMMNTGNIKMNADDIMTNAGNIKMNADNIKTNTDAIAGLTNRVGENATAIGRNESAIMGLQEQMEIVRAGVAASMALAGMPAINGRGISIGVGSYDGESAFAVGFQIQGEMASFKVGVTSAGGETGASAGVGFQF